MMIRLKSLTLSFVLASLCASASLSADDTEIFFAKKPDGGASSAKFLFMFDTSGSMDETDGVGIMRIDRLKRAMLDLLDSGVNVRIGVGAFNGRSRGGSILVPPVTMNEDRCENAACDQIKVRASISSSSDDGHESDAGSVDLGQESLVMSESDSLQTIGLRFTTLNIPRGATIQNASMSFNIHDTSSSDAELEIAAQAVGNAEPFVDASNNLSARTQTSARVSWTPDEWSDVKWSAASTDISSVVQEVVNRSDWCGGNAMALLITGTGKRSAESYDKNPWTAPVLNVNYTPGSVDFTDTCLSQTTQARISSPVDDVYESMSTGEVTTNSDTIDTRDAEGSNTLGLRFQGLHVPQGASVVEARVRLVSADDSNNASSATIYGEDSTYSSVFNANFTHDVSLRVPTGASVAWNDIGSTTSGAGIKSPNLASIVEEIVARPAWTPGNPLTLVFEGNSSSSGHRSFKTLEDGAAASLVVTYQLDETGLGGESVPLRTGRDDLLAAVLDMEALGSTQLVDAYYEAAAYMTGSPVEFGKQRGSGETRDRFYHVSAADSYTGGQYYRPPSCEETDLHSEACVGERIDLSPVYAPEAPASCQADQIVLLSDGDSTTNNARGLVQTMTGKSDCVSRSNVDEECGLELSEWLSTTDHYSAITGDQPIITHTVGFNFSSSFLEEVATTAGGGFYTANSSSELVSIFSNIIATTADINTSFVAPKASVSQSNRLANSNDLYFALFHPRNRDRWDGNLKKYRFAQSSTDPGEVVIVGESGKAAFDDSTGTLNDEAQSLWSDSVDGADVTRGGAASQIRLSRDILTYTDDSSSPLKLEPLKESNDNITSEMLNIDPLQPDLRTELLKWARGVDIKDFDGDGDTKEIRAQMGDPLHSSPTIINYPDRTLVFMGTNEGFLHAIDTLSGAEEFAFIPKTLLGNLDRFFKNAPSTTRTYGLDGPITAWVNDSNGNNIVETSEGESAYLVVGMRRGGRDYYALNVTDPDNPRLAWIIQGGSGDFTELGQTWSKPIRSRVKSNGVSKEVLIFAAGYDARNDNKPLRDKTDTMGRGLFIVDAHTGDRLAYQAQIDQTDLYYSIPSNVRAIDINLDGFVDSIFVGDTGGQLWRFDIDNQSTGDLNSAISGGVIADLGGTDSANHRRFFSEPDVALTSDTTHGEFFTIAIGSGSRAHPLDTAVEDRFHVLRDPAVFGPPRDTSNQISYSKLTASDLFDASLASARDSSSTKVQKGWFMTLPDTGEKSMSKAITVNQQILFTTYLPETGTVGICDVSLGNGRVYAVDALFGGAVANLNSSDDDELTLSDRHRNLKSPGIPPSVSALIPEASNGRPVLLAGPELLPALDFGQLFSRTYWAAH